MPLACDTECLVMERGSGTQAKAVDASKAAGAPSEIETGPYMLPAPSQMCTERHRRRYDNGQFGLEARQLYSTRLRGRHLRFTHVRVNAS